MNEAGLPKGVVNVVLGFGEKAGAALAGHERVDKIVFTGSTEVGSLIMQAASRNLTDFTLELGGKSANIIFADADRDQALMSAAFGCLLHSGQCCCAGTRLLIEKKIHDSFIGELGERFERVRVGNPMDEKTHLGPIMNEKQFNQIDRYVQIGKEKGATVVAGGGRASGVELDKGFFYEPTIFTNTNNDMQISRDEIFGPVLNCMSFEEVDEAIALANDSSYGLVAGF